MTGRRETRLGSGMRYAVLIVGAVVFLVPFYLLLRGALMTEQQLSSPEWSWLPHPVAWSNLSELFANPDVSMARSLFNSFLVAAVQTVGTLVISGMAGYGLARIPYRWSNAVFYVITASLLIPVAVTFVPSFVMISTLGWLSSLRGLIVPGLFQALATFLFRQFFLGFPKEMEEAAALDGLGYWGTFWRIVVPNSLGFTAAIATITFINAWNAFLWPLVIGRDQSSWTVQIALSSLMTAQTSNVSQLFMGAVVSVLPLLLMFLFFQRWIVQGVERTGVAGD